MRRIVRAAALLVALGAGLPAGAAEAAAPALFGTAEFRADSLAPLPQWRRVVDAVQREDAILRACARDPKACPNRGAMAWLALLRRLEGEPRLSQIREVNSFVNGWPYRTDAENYGRSDYWSTPLEFFRRSGDCEDYAIAKYQSLRRLGFAPEQLRLVVLQDVARDLAHAVLAVYLDGEVHILDNLAEAVLAQGRITHYVPYYSVNEHARWTHTAQNALVITASPARVEPARRQQP